MKKLSIITVLFTLIGFKLFSNDLLKKAENAYDTKKYKVAIEAYEELIKQGFTSYQLYFNLGNAYYRNNNLGKAIYNYELARKLEPNDEDVRINLGMASAKTIDKIDAKENFFITAVKSNILSSFTTTTWAWLSILSITLSALLFFPFIHSTVLTVKRISFMFSMVFLIAFFITYLLGFSALRDRYENKFAIILNPEIKVLNEPTATGKSKFTLHEGTKIRVIESNSDWMLIKLDNGNEGWVKLSEIGVI